MTSDSAMAPCWNRATLNCTSCSKVCRFSMAISTLYRARSASKYSRFTAAIPRRIVSANWASAADTAKLVTFCLNLRLPPSSIVSELRRSDFVHAVERRRRPADLEVVCADGQPWVEPQTRGNLIGSRPLQPVLSCLQFKILRNIGVDDALQR